MLQLHFRAVDIRAKVANSNNRRKGLRGSRIEDLTTHLEDEAVYIIENIKIKNR